MAVEIHFKANRATQMTSRENARIGKISQKYMEEYKGKKFEGPGCIVGETGEPVFSGNIKIPYRSPKNELEEFLDHWLKWLTEITYVLVGAEWTADLEDVPLQWENGKGWRLMTDEEYKEMMKRF